ncbi:hypothetical protein [Desulforhopalus sp. IMCC35007]|uniref:hypothetical protein n=1 Tax=Desulforhopalus sp. IMCC35007 TaxID=2569543 RepID=UPI0010ADF480|nr:hypothetical protein [Desulforhopalus sp. IMCC35007]TKB08190.1 hypothetical protein FCL48_14530 [Desulforhopalus sp. IMCC35007]
MERFFTYSVFIAPYCIKPYGAILLNNSTLSFGALSIYTIMPINTLAKLGAFYEYLLAGFSNIMAEISVSYNSLAGSNLESEKIIDP